MKWTTNRFIIIISHLLFLKIVCSCGDNPLAEACKKNYILTGTVTNDLIPLEDVKINWASNAAESHWPLTNSSGVYSFAYPTRAYLEGSQLAFFKDGYITKYAEPYTSEEAGSNKCGDITLIRNAELLIE